MASTGKKGKKSKWIPASITDIIAEPTTVPAAQSWADATEDDVDTSFGAYSSRRPAAPVVLPSASRAARGGLTVDDESIPRRPPFSAYICNLPYDVDEIAINELFAGLKIQNLRLPREGDRLKGYGYVDFEDRESLVDAMNIIDPTISGRKIRIDVSTQDNERRMGASRGGRMGERERDYDPERTQGDWRSGPRVEAEAPPRSRVMDRERPRERERDGSAEMRPGAWRDGDRPAPEAPRSAYGGRDSYGRDRGGGGGGFEDRDRFRDGDRERGYGRDGFRDDRGFNRDSGFRPAGDRDRFRDGDRGGSRGFGERRGFGDRDRERDPPREESKLRERPKLNLLPRTVPLDAPAAPAPQDEAREEPRVVKPTAAQLFGGAKPVDTSAKEREIEERLKKQEEEARHRTDESQRWGRRGDGPADSKGPPKRSDDRGRESRSYRDNRDRRDDRRDYSREKEERRDYSRDKTDKRDYSRDKEDRRDYSRDKDDRRSSRDDRRDYSRDKDDKRDHPRDKDERREYSRDKDDRREHSRDKDDRREHSRDKDDRRDHSRGKDDRRDHSRDKDDRREHSRGKEDRRDHSREIDIRMEHSRDNDKRGASRDKEDKRDLSRDTERRDGSRDDSRRGNGERHGRSKDRRDDSDEIILPQLKQKEAPNFVGTNKFSCLEDAEAEASD